MTKTPVSSLRNLGPAVEESCARAGIHSAEELREMGAHEAYRRLLTQGTRPHFISYYVMHMALQGRPWNDCKGKEKDDLRVAFDTLKAETVKAPAQSMSRLEAALNEIGVIEKKR
jgi:hypothetical protein